MKTKIILFDIDGTLLAYRKSKKIGFRFTYAIKEVFGIDAYITEIDHSGMTDKQVMFELLKLHNISEEEIEKNLSKIFELMAKSMRETIHKIKPKVLPGVRELLELLKKKGCKLGLVTGNIEDVAKIKLKAAKLWDFFEFGGFGGISANRVDLVKEAIKRAKIKNAEVFLVGDSPRDIKCGKEAGTKTIITATGLHNIEQLKPYNPDFIFENLKDTQKIVDVIESA